MLLMLLLRTSWSSQAEGPGLIYGASIRGFQNGSFVAEAAINLTGKAISHQKPPLPQSQGRRQTLPPPLQVACAITGEARTLPGTLASLKKNVIDPVQCDVFLHISAANSVAMWQSSLLQSENWTRKSPDLSAWQLSNVLLALKPVGYSVQQGAHCLNDGSL